MSQALWAIAGSFFGSLGFAVLYNLRGKRPLVPAVGGALFWAFYLLFRQFESEKQYHKSRSQLPLVKVGFDMSAMSKVANQIINDGGYPVAEELPLHKSIPYNISSGRIWSMGLTARSRQPYESLHIKIITAVKRLLDGVQEFHEVWAGGDAE